MHSPVGCKSKRTMTCEVCGGAVYREIAATWDNDQWRHIHPDLIEYPHKVIPDMRSNA